MKNKKLIIFSVLLVGAWLVFCVSLILDKDGTQKREGAVSPTCNVRFAPSNTGAVYKTISLQSNSFLSRRSISLSPIAGTYHPDFEGSALSSAQSSGAKTLYTTSSATARTYGGGSSYSIMGGNQSTKSVNRGVYSESNNSYAIPTHTFIAMSSKVRTTAEEFEYGENAIGADSPNAVRRRTPGSGPVTDDPGHTPTVVTPTPIGNGLYIMMIFSIGYIIRCLKKRNDEIVKL